MDGYMLIEKYRPKDFEDVIGLDPSISQMVGDSMPHMLFVGPPGTGKTTTAKIIISKLKCDKLILNASDERGIGVVREKIKTFAMTSSTDKKIKIIHLDEADFLTPEAQNCLRNLMEEFHKNCRFILTANYENKIIPALQSRCTKFKFSLPDKQLVLNRLRYICGQESLTIGTEPLMKIVEKFYPDIRRCINKLQEMKSLGKTITVEDINTEEMTTQKLMVLLENKELSAARYLILNSTVELDVLLDEVYEYVWANDAYDLATKVRLMDHIAEACKYINHVISKKIIFDEMMIQFIRVFSRK